VSAVPVPGTGLAPVPPEKLLLDRLSGPAQCAYSCLRKLRSAATFAFRVRRTDSTTKDIGFVGDWVDIAALLAFCGSGSGFVTVYYDQSGNGRDLVQDTFAAQPRIVNAGLLETYLSGRIAMSFDGVDDRLRRIGGNATGLAGNPNITAAGAWQWAGTQRIPFAFGAANTDAGASLSLNRTGTGLVPIYKTVYGSGRNFTPVVNPDTDARYYAMQHAAGGNSHTGVLRQNGTNLAQAATTGAAVPLVLLDQNLELGSHTTDIFWFQGKQSCFILFSAVLAGADLATLETELALHTSTPPEPVLDRIPAQATNAYSCVRRLRSGIPFAFRVRRTPDNAEKDIGFVGDWAATADLLAFCGSGSGFVTLMYDQSGHGRDVVQNNIGNAPRIVNAGVLEKYPSGATAMSFDGVSDRLMRTVPGDTTGMTGNPNITMGAVFQMTNTGVSAVCCGFGNVAAPTATTCVLFRAISAATSIKKHHDDTDRNFTLVTAINTNGHAYVLQHTAGDNTHSGSVRQNGVALAPGATTGSAVALNLSDTALGLGANVTGGSLMPGKLNGFILFNALLTGADLPALEAELALHTAAPPTVFAETSVAAPGAPEIGTSMSTLGKESLYYGERPRTPNRAWLAIGSRVVPPPPNISDQGDPLPILFI
jgi:hypothetical protein